MKLMAIPRRTALLAGLALATGLAFGAHAQPVQQVKIAHNLPEHHATGTFFKVLAREIEARTQNTSVKLVPQVFPDGQLYTDAQLPDALSTGAVHIGQVNLGFMAGPDAEALRIWAIPFLYETWEASWAAEDSQAFRDLFSRQLRVYDHEMLGWAPYGSVEIYSNKPVRLPGDVQGMRLRSFGLDSTEYLNDIGAAPMTMSSQEIYQAMQRHTIDGYASGPSSVLSRSLHEVSTHGTNLALSRLTFVASASAMWWDTLPEDVQQAVRDASAVAQDEARQQMRADADRELSELREKGLVIPDPTPEEIVAWIESAAPRRAAYVERVGADAEPIMTAVEAANAQFPAK